MKVVSALAIALLSGSALAGDATYSVSEYCDLKRVEKTQLDTNYLKAYEKRLGFKPSHDECREDRSNRYSNYRSHGTNAEFFMRRPYKGSVIRLSPNQIEMFRSLGVKGADLYGY